MKICIDPGHGGKDCGATTTCNGENLYEDDIALKISLFVEEQLSQAGHQCYLTRRTDRNLSLSARTQFANRYKTDLFISIHCNAAYSATAEGIETWIHPDSTVGGKYALPIQQILASTFSEHKNRGVKEANFHVLRETAMPAVLVEAEFITHPKQARFLADTTKQREIANAIVTGVCSICTETVA